MAKTKEPTKPKTTTKKPEKTARKPPVKKTARKAKIPDEPPEVIRYCSFCGGQAAETRLLIAGPKNIFICEACAEVCIRIFFPSSPTKWQKILLDIIADPENKKALPPEKKQKQPKTKESKEKNNA